MKLTRIYTIVLAIFCLVGVALTGCKAKPGKEEVAREKIAKMVEEMELPKKVPGATLTEVTYEDNVLTYRNEVAADTLAALKKDELKERTLKQLQGSMGSLVANVLDANAKVTYVYYNGSESMQFTITPQELGGSQEKSNDEK